MESSVTVFYPLCEVDGCVIRRPKSISDLVRNTYETATPRNASLVYLSTEREWRFACHLHSQEAFGKDQLRVMDVQADPEKYRVAPPQFDGTGWSAAWSAIVEPMVMFS